MSVAISILSGQIIGLLLGVLVVRKMIKNELTQKAETKKGAIYQSRKDSNINE